MDRISKRIVAGYGVVSVLLALALPLEALARLFQDDAFFYLSIARNFATGKGSSFDGLHPTNGYHPLWMFLLSAVHHLVPLRGALGLRAVILLDAGLFVLTLLALGRLLAKLGLSAPMQRCVTIAAVATVGFANFGLEAFVWVLSFWLFAAAMLRLASGATTGRDHLWVALAVLACYLSRSDSVLFIVLMGGYANLALMKRIGRQKGLAVGLASLWAPLGAVAIGQMLINRALFGNVKTISSALKVGKVSFALEMLRANDGRILQTLLHRGVFLAVYLLSGLMLALLARANWQDAVRNHWRRLLVAANGYVFLFCSAAVVTLSEPPRTWYYTVAFTVLIASAASLLDGRHRLPAAERRGGPLYAVTAVVSLLSLASLGAQFRLSPRANSIAASDWLKSNTSPGTVAYVTDGSGIINYFSERPVIDGDGLVNSFYFKDCVEGRRVAEYIHENQVSIVFANVSDSPLPQLVMLATPSWWHGRSYVFARAPADRALAHFTEGGRLGFLPFRTSDLDFVRPTSAARGAM